MRFVVPRSLVAASSPAGQGSCLAGRCLAVGVPGRRPCAATVAGVLALCGGGTDPPVLLRLECAGLGVFNYDFGSITRESPVIKVRCSVLCCALHALSCAVHAMCMAAPWWHACCRQHASRLLLARDPHNSLASHSLALQAVYVVLKDAEHRAISESHASPVFHPCHSLCRRCTAC